MVTRIEPRVPLVNDEDEELADANRYDATSICTMDVVEEHRYRPPAPFSDPPLPAAPPPRARSPSIYSMFTTDHSHSSRPRCKNPSVYSMPIAAFRARGGHDDDFGGRGIGDEDQSGSSEDDRSYDDDDEDFDDDGDRVFMTRRSRHATDRNTDTHSHMNFRPRCKNPSVYSMPIMGASKREVDSAGRMRTLRVAPLVPLPFAEEGQLADQEKNGYYDSDGTGAPSGEYAEGGRAEAEGYVDDGSRRARSHLKRVTSRRVQPSVKETIATGFTSCRGRPNDDTLPPSYHVTVCVGIVGVVFFFGGMTMAIIGFNSTPTNTAETDDSQKALRVLGPILLCLGFFMCLGCFLYLCFVYTRYKRLSAYLKRRNSARQSQRIAAQQGVTQNGSAADPNRVERIHHSPEAAAEDIRQMLQTLQTGGEIGPRNPSNSPVILTEPGDTPL